MLHLKRWLAIAAMALPTSAFAQYYITLDFTPSGPITCSSTGFTALGSGSVTGNLPLTGNNVVAVFSVNGVSEKETFSQPGPFPFAQPIVGLSANIDSHTQPYTLTETDYPAVNGVATGTGAGFVMVCNADNTGTLTIINGVAAPQPLAVPALPLPVLAGLIALLGMVGAAAARRRRVAPTRLS